MVKKDKHIKPGYHLTEVGIIPTDWIIQPLEKALKIRHWKDQKDIRNISGKFPILGTWGLMGKTNEFLYDKPSVLIWRKWTIDKPQYIDTPFWTVDTLFYSEIGETFVPKFIFYLFNTIPWYSYNEASWVPSLNSRTIESIIQAFPEYSEQSAIAQALSNTDDLISSLDELIEKKKAIKQGTMQELLTGKRRLPWFRNKWSNIAIWDFWFCYWWLTWKSKKDFGSGNARYIPFLNIMRWPVIDINYFDSVNLNVGESQNKAQMYDLFFNWSSETPEELWMCSVLLEDIPDLYLNSFCFWFRIKNLKEIDWLFLSYFFRSNQGRKVIFSLAQWATRYNLSKTAFLKSEISIPDFAEQIAISEIIKNMDSEISELEKKRDKYKQIKQGMMSELLTGNIRLLWVK